MQIGNGDRAGKKKVQCVSSILSNANHNNKANLLLGDRYQRSRRLNSATNKELTPFFCVQRTFGAWEQKASKMGYLSRLMFTESP
jgi:hypothetical protein